MSDIRHRIGFGFESGLDIEGGIIDTNIYLATEDDDLLITEDSENLIV